MSNQVREPPSSPFDVPHEHPPHEYPELISDPAYTREFFKGIAATFSDEAWAKVYKTMKVAIEAFLMNAPDKVNGMLDAYYLGMHVGHAIREVLFE